MRVADRETMPSTLRIGTALAIALIGCSAAHDPATERLGEERQPIINGTASSTDQDDIILVAWHQQGQDFQACSGELIAKNLILTAHHCVGSLDDQTLVVTRMAAADIHIYTGADAPGKVASGKPAAVGKQIFTVTDTTLFPDLALVVLDREVSAPIAPIRLTGGAKKGEALTIVGFGITESGGLPSGRRQRTGVTVIDIAPAPITGDQLNDGEFYFGEAACSGDSGGPALDAKTKAVVGVASRVGNGKQQTQQDPAGFCIGSDTEDIYTALSAAPDLVQAAFKAAGAQPTLEGQAAPPPTTKPDPSTSSSSSADGGADDQSGDPPAPKSVTTVQSSGCSAAPGPSSRPFAIVLALFALAFSRRRRAPS
jgi:MYXO-CTERM domain-containing protein